MKSDDVQLVVVAKPDSGLNIGLDPSSPPQASRDVGPLIELLVRNNAALRPLFGRSEERMRLQFAPLPDAAIGRNALPRDLSAFYVVEAPGASRDALMQLADEFRKQDLFELAYVEPAVGLPVREMPEPNLTPLPPAFTPDFSFRQGYLDPAPGGINARFAWTLPGGIGTGVKVIDIEGGWTLTHEDLLANQGGVVAGAQINDVHWRNHGTAVLGTMGADLNPFGVTGIAPGAFLQAISHNNGGATFPSSVAASILTAVERLSAGDIILIEAHAPGPRFNFGDVGGQLGYVAMQFWPEVYAAITYAAVVKGIIVVEAAGNGAENLDDPIYSNTPGFPPFWSPFNRGFGDNASIIVGAGAPPSGTHGRDWGPDRSRLDFSNFGSCVDAQGWGREVTTTGYGDLQGGPDERLWYTDVFSGTSSASPVVVGALACVQGALRAAGRPALSPIAARSVLHEFGSFQQDAPGRPASQRIGNRPDLFLMLSAMV
jgi:subtilisin family serine protease